MRPASLRRLEKFEELARKLQLDMTCPKELLAIQRREEVSAEARLRMKTLAQKWNTAMVAMASKHGNEVLQALERPFLEGKYDSIVFNTVSPATACFRWSFVKEHLASTTAESAASAAKELEAVAAEKESQAAATESSAVEEKKD